MDDMIQKVLDIAPRRSHSKILNGAYTVIMEDKGIMYTIWSHYPESKPVTTSHKSLEPTHSIVLPSSGAFIFGICVKTGNTFFSI
jgi:glutathionylspermidine synthase